MSTTQQHEKKKLHVGADKIRTLDVSVRAHDGAHFDGFDGFDGAHPPTGFDGAHPPTGFDGAYPPHAIDEH